jgi:hypothetical protein
MCCSDLRYASTSDAEQQLRRAFHIPPSLYVVVTELDGLVSG